MIKNMYMCADKDLGMLYLNCDILRNANGCAMFIDDKKGEVEIAKHKKFYFDPKKETVIVVG